MKLRNCDIKKINTEDDYPCFRYTQREHTILLSRERVNKRMKRMNRLPLSPVIIVISYATIQGKPLLASPVQHCSVKLVPKPFRAFGLCIKFDKGGNSLSKHFEHNPNIRSNL